MCLEMPGGACRKFIRRLHAWYLMVRSLVARAKLFHNLRLTHAARMTHAFKNGIFLSIQSPIHLGSMDGSLLSQAS